MRLKTIFPPALMVLAFVLSSCAKEETSKPPLDSFLGEWEAFTYEAVGAGNWQYIHTLVFNADSTFTYHRLSKFEEQRINYDASGTFSVQGNRVILSYTKPTETTGEYSYEFTATSVILTSTSMPGDVMEYVLQP